MFQNNPLLTQLKQQLHAQMPRVEGIVKSTDKNFGFLEVNSNKSYFIPPNQMKKVMHGDQISATIHKDNDREFAKPESLITPYLTRFVGRVHCKGNRLFVSIDRLNSQDLIPCRLACHLSQALQQDDWVIAEIIQHPLAVEHGSFKAKIVDYITDAKDNFAPWWVTLAHHQLEKIPPALTVENPTDINSDLRIDLTHYPFFTIDSAKTEDMDDAIYIEKLEDDHLKLHVAIADPTAYIREGDELDCLAKQRAFSCYLPGFDIPMLPEELSKDRFSLRPNEKRAALVCSMIINAEGALIDEGEFKLAWISSQAKLNYDHVSDWLENEGHWQPEHTIIANQLQLLQRFALLRIEWRQQNALTFKDKQDYRFIIDDNGNITDIKVEARRVAHRMIEEAMIAANLCAANTLKSKVGFAIFNIHAGFETNKFDTIARILQEKNLTFDINTLTTLEGYCQFRQLLNKQSSDYLDLRIQRYQSYADMALLPSPHFALGFECYATWTSPIRKYSDMVNHRLLKSILTTTTPIKPDDNLLRHINRRRRLLRVAEREISEWLYCRYLQDSLNNSCFSATIIDITKGGIRAKLIANGAIVFIPLKFIHPRRNEIRYDLEKAHITINDVISYRQGDQISVIIAEIKVEARHIIASLKQVEQA